MTDNNVNIKPSNAKYSVISIISFGLCILAILLAFFNIMSNTLSFISSQGLKYFFGGLLILVSISSTVLAFIDVLLKNRKKTLSIIALVFSGGFFFLVILIILTLYTANPSP